MAEAITNVQYLVTMTCIGEPTIREHEHMRAAISGAIRHVRLEGEITPHDSELIVDDVAVTAYGERGPKT